MDIIIVIEMGFYGSTELEERTFLVTQKKEGSQKDFTEEIAFELHDEEMMKE